MRELLTRSSRFFADQKTTRDDGRILFQLVKPGAGACGLRKEWSSFEAVQAEKRRLQGEAMVEEKVDVRLSSGKVLPVRMEVDAGWETLAQLQTLAQYVDKVLTPTATCLIASSTFS